jgi:hypothetical protein
MAVIEGTIVGVSQTGRNFTGIGTVHECTVAVSFPAYVATTDSINIAGVSTRIQSDLKNGKTITLARAECKAPGKNSAGTACYAGDLTVSTAALTGGLKDGPLTGSSEVSVPLGTVVPVQITVLYTES